MTLPPRGNSSTSCLRIEKEDLHMNALLSKTVCCIFTLVVVCISAKAPLALTKATRVANAANAFLATLDQKQRQSVMFAYDDEKQRARWSNLPTTMVPRAGLTLRELNPSQR